MSDRTPPPVLAFRNGSIGFGGEPLFENADIILHARERACLVGRNGSGKSTLLKILSGQITPDAGDLFLQPGKQIGYLPQSVSVRPDVTVHQFVGSPDNRPPPEAYQVDEIIAQVQLDGAQQMSELSGGEARRAALAQCLVGMPDILLLDEPTNHLDIPTIIWLEQLLRSSKAAILMISHDRAFLDNVSTNTLWLRRDQLLASGSGHREFDRWADEIARSESHAADKLKQKIKAEQHWLIHGVTARRKRNQGRLKKLSALRSARAALLKTRGNIALTIDSDTTSGRLVVDAEHLAKSYGDRKIIDDFSTRIMRGDRIGIVGRNGSGKTTLINLLLGRETPDGGAVRLGTNLEVAYFDQTRSSLTPDATLWDTMLPGGGDSIMVHGRQRHIVSYLREFLFDEKQAKSPVGSLSGGEQNRLLLAKTLAQPANFLVLDEPTNDLDMETLDVLEDLLAEFSGTILMVSHDRDFLDRIVTSTIVLPGDGSATEYAGGWSDAPVDLDQVLAPARAPKGPKSRPVADRSSPPTKRKHSTSQSKLSFSEQRELDTLPEKIERLEDAKSQLEAVLADPDLYQRDRNTHADAIKKLTDVQDALHRAEDRWLALEARREELQQGAG